MLPGTTCALAASTAAMSNAIRSCESTAFRLASAMFRAAWVFITLT